MNGRRLLALCSLVAGTTAQAPTAAAQWSLQPIASPAVPVASPRGVNAIDAFVEARLREAGLSPSPPATRRELIRRVTFDLTGLPPAPTAIAAFLADDEPGAFARAVDVLLASPRFGERFARPWLDLVHFGETHGFDKDKPRPHAYPYRDWVIDAFNRDQPWAQFVTEQLAGDVLFDRGEASSDALVATGCIAAGPWDFVGHVELREGSVDKAITRLLDRDDMVMTVMSTFASTTAHCARCHDHKFDPIPQRDYYALQAVFAGVERAERSYDADPAVATARGRLLAARAALDAQPVDLGAARADIDRALEALPPLARVYCAARDFTADGTFTPSPSPRLIHVLKRGDVNNPRDVVSPGALACVSELPAHFALAADAPEGERRLALARWLVDRRNPLSWRSVVNRVWQWHFGRGLVDTPNDFGRMGEAPTDPALLDWLATWFRDGGGSLKALHRLIVTSATYQQSSMMLANGNASTIDGDNRLLWRGNRQRLDAEQIRDALLAISGRLDLRMGGPSDRHFVFHDDHSPVYDYAAFDPDAEAGRRRSIYRFVVRSVPDPFFESADCPDASVLTPKRSVTITALQALTQQNHRLVLAQCRHLAVRLQRERPGDVAAQVALLFELALGRPPEPHESNDFVAHAATHGLATACRVLVNLNEFLFVD